jgi:hypothetical protein
MNSNIRMTKLDTALILSIYGISLSFFGFTCVTVCQHFIR